MNVPVRLLRDGAREPTYARAGDAGADLCSTAELTIPPGGRAVVPTGVALAIPDGHAGFVHPRSGLAAHCGLTVLNAPGTIDAGYRGEIMVILANLDRAETVRIRRGDRIAQLVIQRVERACFARVETLPESERGLGGHGSTGGHAALDGRRPDAERGS